MYFGAPAKQKPVHAGRSGIFLGLFTWDWRRGHGGQDGVLSLGNSANPVLVSVTVEVVPPGKRPVGAAHHLNTLLAALVVVGLPVTPVGVADRGAIAPGVSCMMGRGRFSRVPISFHQGSFSENTHSTCLPLLGCA